MSLLQLVETLRASPGFAHKRDIAPVVSALALAGQPDTAVPVGDDCAAIPDGDGHLLFAIEGFVNGFVAAEPWFAGWCGVMVNISDIAAMGGRPVAVVDALWSDGAAEAKPILEGLRAAAEAYGVPIVGGHSNTRCDRPQLAVSIIGRAGPLLTSFDARPGDRLMMAVDLRGRYHEPNPFFDAATSAPPERLRGDLALLPGLAEDGLCRAAKDISMAGAIGTALMLLECSGTGGTIDVTAVPRPPGVLLDRWLLSFPSFGFLLSVPPEHTEAVAARFAARGLACAAIGTVEAGTQVALTDGDERMPLWNFADSPLIGCGPKEA
ncbi:sll0787 family AIR synthase-like protein [Azospirillum rugosum]|uniref:AIR synthase-related protein n=1 Tax=Azospirillum rugosum TaxID=416170 RepID=A0ABS4SME0_9PROT|nr:sll0787 family AIR synthase-like protein [Azospirillum rugosum]MBP2293728.1 AIR synthase-related protein [Azospirillum rugosum]MDQ0527273.1 AIR synthase-related protein [Azospirillum rugosum]